MHCSMTSMTPHPNIRHTLIHELFEQQASAQPDAVAVAFENDSLTYAELDARANQLAHELIALGVQPDDRVAICVERSLEMVVGLLGILKAGGAYVPLDPTYPADRLQYMLQDSAPKALLTQQSTNASQRCAPLLLTTTLAHTVPGGLRQAEPGHVECLCERYSGSTGMPKGYCKSTRVWSMFVGRRPISIQPMTGSAENAVRFRRMVWEFFLRYWRCALVGRPGGLRSA